LIIAKLNLRETVLKQKNAKHNSRENKLVYIIKISGIFFYLIVICIPIKSHQSNQTCSAT
jgi:hypothetical protein